MLVAMRTAIRISLAAIVSFALLIPVISGGVATAVPSTKSISFDCSSNNQNQFGGDVYLKPGESFTVQFVNCHPDIYIDVDTDPTIFTSVIMSPSSDGNIVFYADGTYIINATVAPSQSQGVWHSANAAYAYVWLDPNSQSMNDYVGVYLVGDDASEVSQAQVQNLMFDFPGLLSQSDLFTGVAALDECITYDPSQPGGIAGHPVPFKALDFVVQTPGNVTIRTESTFPTTSFTSYLENPSAGLGSMLSSANYLLYDDFDPQNPGDGLIACGDYIPEESAGDYLASGEIRMNSYAELSTQLNTGTYTLVAVPRESLTLQDWQNFAGNQNQYIYTEVWTPLPQVAASPALAATGRNHLGWFFSLGAVFGLAGVSLVGWRKMRTRRTIS